MKARARAPSSWTLLCRGVLLGRHRRRLLSVLPYHLLMMCRVSREVYDLEKPCRGFVAFRGLASDGHHAVPTAGEGRGRVVAGLR